MRRALVSFVLVVLAMAALAGAASAYDPHLQL